MCGIVSTLNHNEEVVEKMLQEIQHRGKDNRSIYENKNVHLGHNRLSINDVSSDGNQPFIWKDYALVVNGEIWNYPQLRKEYETVYRALRGLVYPKRKGDLRDE